MMTLANTDQVKQRCAQYFWVPNTLIAIMGGEVCEICLYQMEKVPDWIQESILLLTTY